MFNALTVKCSFIIANQYCLNVWMFVYVERNECVHVNENRKVESVHFVKSHVIWFWAVFCGGHHWPLGMH